MERNPIVTEFTRQAESFNTTAELSSVDALGRLLELLPTQPGDRWLDAACGPGLVARALAPRVAEVHGVDLTPTMIEVARREAARTQLANALFEIGDATALPYQDGSFDGALTRFSLHHIPLPGRAINELARLVRPGGWIAVSDHVTSPDSDLAHWHQEIERLRDPTHWACLTRAQLLRLGEQAGLELHADEQRSNRLDFDDWLARGSGGITARELIEAALATNPPGTAPFAVETGPDGSRTLALTLQLVLWQRPG